MDQLFDSHSVGLFFLYFVTGIVLWIVFKTVYLWITPYDEAADIRAGKLAPAIALVGAEAGFLMPLFSASLYGGSWYGFVAWAILAGVVQVACFKVLYWQMPHVGEDNRAVALVFAGASICLGAINAFSMIP